VIGSLEFGILGLRLTPEDHVCATAALSAGGQEPDRRLSATGRDGRDGRDGPSTFGRVVGEMTWA
jgi:hypothetical protein